MENSTLKEVDAYDYTTYNYAKQMQLLRMHIFFFPFASVLSVCDGCSEHTIKVPTRLCNSWGAVIRRLIEAVVRHTLRLRTGEGRDFEILASP